jgi:hypothetical protein
VYAGVAWLRLEILGAWTMGGDVTAGLCLEKTSGMDFINNIHYLVCFCQFLPFVADHVMISAYDNAHEWQSFYAGLGLSDP